MRPHFMEVTLFTVQRFCFGCFVFGFSVFSKVKKKRSNNQNTGLDDSPNMLTEVSPVVICK